MIRPICVALLLLDAVAYAGTVGWKSAAAWLAAAIVTAKWLPVPE